MARDPHTTDCAIRDCTRAAGRSTLCREHHQLVPFEWSTRLAVDIAMAAHELARERHEQWATWVQHRVDTGDVTPREKREPHYLHATGMAAAAWKRT